MDKCRQTKRSRRLVAAGAATLVAVASGSLAPEADAAVIYRENFTNTTGAQQPLGHAGWKLHRGATASELTVTSDFPRIGTGNGEPDLQPSVNSSPVNADAQAGFVYIPDNRSSGVRWPFLAWTEEYSIDRTLYSDLTFGTVTNVSGSDNNTDETPDSTRVAIRIGGNWFVSNPSRMTNTSWATAYANGYESASLSGDWYALTFNPGSAFAVGADTTTLPATGNIDAFGFYTDQVSLFADHRYSVFEIDAAPVPEPVGFAMFGAAGTGLLLRRRRTQQ